MHGTNVCVIIRAIDKCIFVEVSTAVKICIVIFWVETSCFVGCYRRFGGTSTICRAVLWGIFGILLKGFFSLARLHATITPETQSTFRNVVYEYFSSTVFWLCMDYEMHTSFTYSLDNILFTYSFFWLTPWSTFTHLFTHLFIYVFTVPLFHSLNNSH